MTIKGLWSWIRGFCASRGRLRQMLVTHWPGDFGNDLRYRYYKRRLRRLGKGAVIEAGVFIPNPALVSIGDNTLIDRNVTIIAGRPTAGGRKIHHKANPDFRGQAGEVIIGSDVHIAPYAYLLGHGGLSVGDRSCITAGAKLYSISNHYRNLDDATDLKLYAFSNMAPLEDQALIVGPIVVGVNAAVGLNSIVLPGCTIGDNSWVGVQSYVIENVPPNVIAMGSPAKVVRQRPLPPAAEGGAHG